MNIQFNIGVTPNSVLSVENQVLFIGGLVRAGNYGLWVRFLMACRFPEQFLTTYLGVTRLFSDHPLQSVYLHVMWLKNITKNYWPSAICTLSNLVLFTKRFWHPWVRLNNTLNRLLFKMFYILNIHGHVTPVAEFNQRLCLLSWGPSWYWLFLLT